MADTAEVIKQRAALRAAIKKEFTKQVTNPHRHASGEGGYLFDPAIQRFMSMRATPYDHFKQTPRSSLTGLALFVIPLVGYGLWLKNAHESFEEKCSTGMIAYKDRQNKFV